MLAEHLGKPLTAIPDPFGTHDELRRAQQRPAARLPRPLRLRLRIRLLHRLLPRRAASTRRCCAWLERLRRGAGRSSCRRSGAERQRHLFALPADHPEDRRGHAGADRWRCDPARRHRRLAPIPTTGTAPRRRSPAATCKLQWKADWALRWYALGVDYEMSGKDLIDSVKLSSADLPGPGRHAAGELHLRAVHRRERPEDQQVQGQRPDHRGVAALRPAREPGAVHVPVAAAGQAAVLRRHPPRGRRIPRATSRSCAAESRTPTTTRPGTSMTAAPNDAARRSASPCC